MKSFTDGVLGYVRGLFGWNDEKPAIRTSFKRDRADDDLSSDDDTPASKRLKQLRRTKFPDIMTTNDIWKEEKPSKNVRLVPIEIEVGHPSTSTPNEVLTKSGGRHRSVHQYVDMKNNHPSTPARKPRMHTPVWSAVHSVPDHDEDESEATWVQSKPRTKKSSKVYIDLDDEENDENQDNDDVIFVRKVTTPPAVKPYKFFVTRNNHDVTDSTDNEPVYYRLERRNESSNSPKSYGKFIAPPGISKSYKKALTPLPRWLQSQNNMSNVRSRYLGPNIYNLDDKRNYGELIKKVMQSAKRTSLPKHNEIAHILEESASFRMTQRLQKQTLNEIYLAEKGLIADKLNEATKEYGTATVTSINSSDSEIEIVPSESSSSSVRINPVNSLKDSLKDRPIISNDYLTKLHSKYNKKKHDTHVKLHDVQRESEIISKLNHEQKIAQLEHKLKNDLCIPDSLVEEPQPIVELPELTPEQEKLINKVLGRGPPGQLLVEKFNLRIHRRDLQTLTGLNWLNDEVINFYMNLLMQRCEERKDLPKVYAANTFFYPKLMQGGQAGLRRWTRKVDIFAHDLMVVPVHLGVHWCLSLVDFRAQKVSYLDSMGGRNQPCLDALVQYLRDEHQDKKGQAFDASGWKTECLSKDIPQQMNGSDCGMFACTFAEFSCRGAPYTFTQSHMPYLRRKMALEIVQGKLML